MAKLALISGIPGTGKSYFGHWAEKTHGVLCVDADHSGVDQAGIRAEWEEFVKSFDARPILAKLSRNRAACAFVWGFPVRSLPWVRALAKTGGFVPWWFAGDRDWARKYYGEREGTTLPEFDRQHADIGRAWPQIAAVFGERILETVASDGTRAPCEELYRRIFEAGKTSA